MNKASALSGLLGALLVLSIASGPTAGDVGIISPKAIRGYALDGLPGSATFTVEAGRTFVITDVSVGVFTSTAAKIIQSGSQKTFLHIAVAMGAIHFESGIPIPSGTVVTSTVFPVTISGYVH